MPIRERNSFMTHWTAATCKANGIDIHYLRTGGAAAANKVPVVLLHGLTGSGACWSPLARALEAEFDVVMPDARGHGNSSTPANAPASPSSNAYRYEDHAHDVMGLIDALGLAAPIVLGHSMGGMTAAVLAAALTAGMPGQIATRIRGVILADPTFLSPQRQQAVYASDAIEQHRRLLKMDKAEVLAQARARHAHRRPELVELATEARLKTRIEAFDVLTPPNPAYRALMRAIQVPILLVIGDSGVVSLEVAQALRPLNSRLRIEQIQDAGHALQYDQPERFEAVVKSFLRDLTGSSPRIQ